MTEHTAENDEGGCVPCRVCGGSQSRGWHLHDRAENDAGCVECGGVIDRTIPDPIPEGYECMWSEAMSGRALYCQACYGATGGDR